MEERVYMIFQTFGNSENTVIVMLAGSFCPSESLETLYSQLKNDYFIIAPTYNGCSENSRAFTSRQGEATEICSYIKNSGITAVKMIYGQSMGCEIGIELMKQLLDNGILVESGFFDGAPCSFLPKPIRKIMYIVFKRFAKAFQGATLEEAMNIGLVKLLSNKDPEALKPMIESILSVSPYLTDETIRNQVECCYTFDFPRFEIEVERKLSFFYGKAEKAYRLCFKKTKKSYPNATYIVKNGYGHCTYMSKNTEEYIRLLRSTMN